MPKPQDDLKAPDERDWLGTEPSPYDVVPDLSGDLMQPRLPFPDEMLIRLVKIVQYREQLDRANGNGIH